MKGLSHTLTTCALAFTLSACGTTPSERGLSGAGLGAAAGAAGAAISGGGVATGAAIGAAAGAAAGALTEEEDVDLGEPAWQ